MASKINIARNLLIPAFRGIEFIPTNWDFSFDQGHAAHLYPDRDAGFIEGTGRNPSKHQFTALFRNDLDAAVADVSPEPSYPESLSPSALETMKALSGSVDMFKRGIGNIGAAIDSTLGGLEQFADTLASVGELGSDPNIAKAMRSLSRCSDALLNLSLTVTSKGKPITQAITQNDAAADTVASFFGMGLDDFLRLNPRAASKPRIARNTSVFIFA